jgi:hypothetical protein
MLKPYLICPKCQSEMANITSWDDARERFYCFCGHEETGDPVDPADVRRSQVECAIEWLEVNKADIEYLIEQERQRAERSKG